MPYIGKKPADIIATAVDTTTGTFSGEVDAASLDISGNIDVDGTTNLDVVDIDGTLNVQGETTLQTHLNMGDNDIIKVGDSADLQIYHDGSNSYIDDTGTGILWIRGDASVRIGKAGTTEVGLRVESDSYTKLYYDNAEKLATTNTGIDVTGTATMDGLTVDGSSTGTLNNVNFLNTNSGATQTANRLGLGITNSGGAAYTYIEANEDGVDSFPHLNFYTGSSATKRLEIEDNGDISFYEDTGTTPKLFWQASTERLGIGTSTMFESLRVVGTRQNTAVGYDTVVSFYSDDAFSSNAGAGLSFGGKYNTAGSITAFAEIAGVKENSTDGNYAGALVLKTRTNGTSNITERMRITSNGELLLATAKEIASNPGLTIANASGDLSRPAYLNLFRDDRSLSSGQELGKISFYGSDGTVPGDPVKFAFIDAVASGTHGAGDNPTDLVFGTTDDGSATVEEAMRISDGRLLVGQTSRDYNSTGVSINGYGYSHFTGDDYFPMLINRKTTDGDIIHFYKDTAQIGSIGTFDAGYLYIASTRTTDAGIKIGTSRIVPSTTTGADRDGAIDLGYSSGRWKDLYLSGGVVFGSTGGSVTSKTLDDYEEGTWTPTVYGATTAGTATFSGTIDGWYVKVGDLVTVSFSYTLTAHTGTGKIRIGGLPFNSTTLTNYQAVGTFMTNNYDFSDSSPINSNLYFGRDVDFLRIYITSDNLGWTEQDLDSAHAIIGSVTYRTGA